MIYERRPWGWMIKPLACPLAWVKLIRVHPGQRTSLQRHRSRWEYHVGMTPQGWHRKKIGLYQLHRMCCGWYLEFAWGLPSESDIERCGDDYGRL